MTGQEKEEDYELLLYISTFMSEDTLTEDTSKLQLMTIQQPQHQQEIIPTQQQGEEETEKPEYMLTKENIRQLATIITKSRKNLDSPAKGKGKCQLILQENSEDEDKIHAQVTEILIEATKNKIPVEE